MATEKRSSELIARLPALRFDIAIQVRPWYLKVVPEPAQSLPKGKPNSRQRDHIDPSSKGGNNSEQNKADSCRECNRDKSNKSLWDWVKDKFGMSQDTQNGAN
jgi:hypothetical protein